MAGLGADIDGKPALAVTYDGDERILLERMAPLVDLLEISPDAIAGSDGREQHLRSEVLAELENALPHVKLIAHGVGLSIGSFDRWEERYLHLLDELFARFELQWHSEHLAYTVVAGENSGTMLPLPRSAEALDLICERVGLIQQRYGVPFLLEHVIALLPDAPAAFTPAGFLNEITSRTGCGLVLDAYNLECDAHNRGLDIPAFFAELDFAPVTELHLADGVLRNGFRLDIHTGTTRDDTLALAREIIERAPNLRAVTYEFIKQAVPFLGHDAICDELVRIRQTLLAPP
jgi:uncharacterized protein (UPF0276 family)